MGAVQAAVDMTRFTLKKCETLLDDFDDDEDVHVFFFKLDTFFFQLVFFE